MLNNMEEFCDNISVKPSYVTFIEEQDVRQHDGCGRGWLIAGTQVSS